jgi:beta-xylosidase
MVQKSSSPQDAFGWNQMSRYGLGVYAPTIRYHDGKFWVFVNFNSDGFFVATAKNPAGRWDISQIKDRNGKPLRTQGWTDPCPFWDDDGKAHLACCPCAGSMNGRS